MRMDIKRVKETAEHGAFGGGSNVVVAPPGFELWAPEEAGTYILRICPYPVTLEGHPDGVAVGEWHYRRPYGIHWNVGDSGQAAICLRDSFRQSDAVCSRMTELRAEGFEQNKEAILANQSKRNCLFAVIDVVNDPKKVKIFDWSFSKFGKELEKALKIATPEQCGFAQPSGGAVLKVIVVTDSFNGKKYFKVVEGDNFGGACPGITFLPAKGPTGDFTNLSDNILDQLENCKLDECLIITPAEKIAQLFSGVADDAAADDAPVDETPVETTDEAPAWDAGKWGEAPDETPAEPESEPEPEPEPAPRKPTGKPVSVPKAGARATPPPPPAKGGKLPVKPAAAAPKSGVQVGGKKITAKDW
jgi:hypothetical protein